MSINPEWKRLAELSTVDDARDRDESYKSEPDGYAALYGDDDDYEPSDEQPTGLQTRAFRR